MIILVGMPCSGKSYYSDYFGRLLNSNYFDTDQLFEELFFLSPVNFIKKNGWDKFREREYSILNEFISKNNNQDNIILATGGGILEYEPSYTLFESLKNIKSYTIVHLFIHQETYIERYVKRKETINYSYNEMTELYNKRIQKYKDISHLSLDCNNFNNSKQNFKEIKKYLLNTH